jgi:predicted nucleic acid-binding protein
MSDPKYLNFLLFLIGGPLSEAPPPFEISGSATGMDKMKHYNLKKNDDLILLTRQIHIETKHCFDHFLYG